MRRFTPQVEEYSIDEAFADLTGMRRALRASYETIALKIQGEIARELGITVSVGLSTTKVLAKIASKRRKPSGFTAIPSRAIPSALDGLPVEKVWGIGPAAPRLELQALGLWSDQENGNRRLAEHFGAHASQ